jgi:hypothetical protein
VPARLRTMDRSRLIHGLHSWSGFTYAGHERTHGAGALALPPYLIRQRLTSKHFIIWGEDMFEMYSSLFKSGRGAHQLQAALKKS